MQTEQIKEVKVTLSNNHAPSPAQITLAHSRLKGCCIGYTDGRDDSGELKVTLYDNGNSFPLSGVLTVYYIQM